MAEMLTAVIAVEMSREYISSPRQFIQDADIELSQSKTIRVLILMH